MVKNLGKILTTEAFFGISFKKALELQYKFTEMRLLASSEIPFGNLSFAYLIFL